MAVRAPGNYRSATAILAALLSATFLLLVVQTAGAGSQDALISLPSGSVTVGGEIGRRIDVTINPSQKSTFSNLPS